MVETIFPPFTTLATRTIVLAEEDIDTDQIVPARFMSTTTRTRLGEALFRDWRYYEDGRPVPDHPLNRIVSAERRVLVAGRNFGSGSSREHAPWALLDFGIRVIISSKIADIFAGNAVRNGLLTLTVPRDVHVALLAADGAAILVDLEREIITLPDLQLTYAFKIDPFSRTCLLSGRDPLGWLLDQSALIGVYQGSATVPLADLSKLLLHRQNETKTQTIGQEAGHL